MKAKQPLLKLFLVYQLGFSQSEKLIQGRVLCDDFPLQGIEIVNIVNEKSTKTDINGRFSISVKVEDMLVFVSEKYEYKRLLSDQEFLDKKNFTILLTRKLEKLEEVVIISKISFPKIKFDKNIASQLTVEKSAINRKPTGIYDGTIDNGFGIAIPLGGSRKKNHQIEFKELMKNNYDHHFYVEILKLAPEDVRLFIEYCDADPKSNAIVDNTNTLKVMEFLLVKNTEFKKLATLEKQ